jgi:hypothetical protein
MTKSFLSRVAEDILKNSGTDLRDFVLVFPNIRSGSEMRRELALKISKPAWSPRIVSIDKWLTGLSGLSVADHLVELAYLYKVMIREIPTTGSFSDFIDLGETILSDFDDLDKYLVDTRKLFTVLTELKKIDSQFELSADPELLERIRLFWGGFQAGKSEHQEKWLEIWNRLFAVYEGFQNAMLEKGLGTSGMCYRKATELIAKRLEGQEIQTRFLFIGFNILTKTEETLFRQLQLAGLAGFYWDYHPGYMTQDHEAGKFIRQNLDLFPANADFFPFEPDNTEFLSGLTDQKIRVLPSSSDTGQIQLMLSEIQLPQAKRRGIILADEGLFTDLLSAWPDDIPVNFTSGYPLKDTQAAGYIINVLKVWLNFQTSGLQQVCRSSFLLDVLRHPWSRLVTGGSLDEEIQQIQRSYPDYVPTDLVLSWKVSLPLVSDGKDSSGFLLQLESSVSLLK